MKEKIIANGKNCYAFVKNHREDILKTLVVVAGVKIAYRLGAYSGYARGMYTAMRTCSKKATIVRIGGGVKK